MALAITVMNSTFASSPRLDMYTHAFATSLASNVGSDFSSPFACLQSPAICQKRPTERRM
jgi:hypothetical protein